MEPQNTPKQAVEKYQGNLSYFRRGHYLRWLKLSLFLLSVLVSLAAVMTYPRWGNSTLFSTGPISANHAGFAGDCRQCHEGAEPDLAKRLKSPRLIEATLRGKMPSGEKAAKWLLQKTALTRMDQACAKCHDPEQLHQPQAAALAMRGFISSLAVVHSSSCSECHREHVGTARMKLPDSRTCEGCHNDAARLQRSLTLVKLEDATPPTAPASLILPDGLRHFIVPRPGDRRLTPFKSFAEGHPAFEYETKAVKDPTVLNFNHQRHGQKDIPKINGHALNCTDCHKTTGDGAFFGRITFAQHCNRCHSLQVDPEMPGLTLPHGEPAAVRAYVEAIQSNMRIYAERKLGLNKPDELDKFVKERAERLKQRGLTKVEEFENRIFYTGDPPQTAATPVSKLGKAVFLPACVKCHALTPAQPATGTLAPLPKVTFVTPPDRWLTRGPFTHAKHTYMSCAACHDDPKLTLTPVRSSTHTSDILLPRQAICAECHHPADPATARPIETVGLKPEQVRLALTEKQRKEGGVVSECQTCHRFHTLEEAIEFAQPLLKN